MSELPPINESMLDHAARLVRRTLDLAERGDEKAKRDVLRMAAADALELTLMRVAHYADGCAPSHDEIKINRSQFTPDAVRLRFELDTVASALNQAAGRAVVVELPVAASPDEAPSPLPPGRDTRCNGDASDNGELPRVPLSGGAA